MAAMTVEWKRRMSGKKNSKIGNTAGEGPAWYAAGLAHVWLPYAQMKTARFRLPSPRRRAAGSCWLMDAN